MGYEAVHMLNEMSKDYIDPDITTNALYMDFARLRGLKLLRR